MRLGLAMPFYVFTREEKFFAKAANSTERSASA